MDNDYLDALDVCGNLMTDSGAQYRTVGIEPGLAGLTNEQLDMAYGEAVSQQISLRESVLALGLTTETELL
ncbi:MAG: hypothetical protein ACYS29_16025, partial [Planctomycetota bacterium]